MRKRKAYVTRFLFYCANSVVPHFGWQAGEEFLTVRSVLSVELVRFD